MAVKNNIFLIALFCKLQYSTIADNVKFNSPYTDICILLKYVNFKKTATKFILLRF